MSINIWQYNAWASTCDNIIMLEHQYAWASICDNVMHKASIYDNIMPEHIDM